MILITLKSLLEIVSRFAAFRARDPEHMKRLGVGGLLRRSRNGRGGDGGRGDDDERARHGVGQPGVGGQQARREGGGRGRRCCSSDLT